MTGLRRSNAMRVAAGAAVVTLPRGGCLLFRPDLPERRIRPEAEAEDRERVRGQAQLYRPSSEPRQRHRSQEGPGARHHLPAIGDPVLLLQVPSGSRHERRAAGRERQSSAANAGNRREHWYRRRFGRRARGCRLLWTSSDPARRLSGVVRAANGALICRRRLHEAGQQGVRLVKWRRADRTWSDAVDKHVELPVRASAANDLS